MMVGGMVADNERADLFRASPFMDTTARMVEGTQYRLYFVRRSGCRCERRQGPPTPIDKPAYSRNSSSSTPTMENIIDPQLQNLPET